MRADQYSDAMQTLAYDTADRLRASCASYAAMRADEVAEAAELLARRIVAAGQGKGTGPLDRHLERMLELRIEQGIPPADIAVAFSQIRRGLADLAEDDRVDMDVDRETLLRSVDAAESRVLQRLGHRDSH